MSINHATAVFVDSEGKLTEEWHKAMHDLGYSEDQVKEFLEETKEQEPHYHVVEFISGCLNDFDSGPIETLEEAREQLLNIIEQDRDNLISVVPGGKDRYIVRGVHVLKIEECTEDITSCFDATEKGY